jgi:transcriptional regulator with XRE-family HTH domain
MGGAKRMRPERLGEKLLAIRNRLDCSLAQMADRLSNEKFSVNRTDISRYELSKREPPLPVLLRYARLAKVTIDVLVDDEADLL